MADRKRPTSRTEVVEALEIIGIASSGPIILLGVFTWVRGEVEPTQKVGSTLVIAIAIVIFTLLAIRISIKQGKRSREASDTFRRSTERLLESIAADPTPALEDEIAEVSSSLSSSVTRLRALTSKAEAFQAEVKSLVEQADAAKATAKLNAEDAQKIGHFLSMQTEQLLREEIARLREEHAEQLKELKKSANRTALLTFVGGVLLGFAGNVVSALIM